MLKTPKFWSSVNLISIILYPLSLLYYFCYKIRIFLNRNSQYVSKIPVICVGNLTVGGSGKTPICVELAKILKQKNKSFCFLSRGYGGSAKTVVKVKTNDSPIFVGEEPLILANFGDAFVSKNKVAGLKFINNNFNYDYIIIDDGLQNPTFKKNKIILVLDGGFGFGNGFIFPAGALRDKLKNIYKSIDLAIIVGEDRQNISEMFKKLNINYTTADIVANVEEKMKNKEYLAFCGIGRPEKFKKTLLENNIKFTKFIEFGDHYFYSENKVKNMLSENKNLITTEKDWLKLGQYKNNVDFLKITINFNNNSLETLI